MLIEFFSLGVTAEAVQANIGSKSAIEFSPTRAGWTKILGRCRPTNHSSSQRTRPNDLSYGIKNLDRSFYRSRSTDGRTDRRTDTRRYALAFHGARKKLGRSRSRSRSRLEEKTEAFGLVSVSGINVSFFPRCTECQRGLVTKKVSVRLSVYLSVCQTYALWRFTGLTDGQTDGQSDRRTFRSWLRRSAVKSKIDKAAT